MARTPENIINYYLNERGKDLEYVRQIALARNDNALKQAVEELLNNTVEVECVVVSENESEVA